MLDFVLKVSVQVTRFDLSHEVFGRLLLKLRNSFDGDHVNSLVNLIGFYLLHFAVSVDFKAECLTNLSHHLGRLLVIPVEIKLLDSLLERLAV